MEKVNPIQTVDSVAIPCPSSYQWKLGDISASGAGRTEDTVMHKLRIGQAVQITLGWQNVSTSVASEVLQAFNPEYITVSYLDPTQGGFVTTEFYVSDRSALLYNASMGLWSNITFTIIERSGQGGA